MSPKDSIAGMWDLVSVKRNNKDITLDYDSESNERIFIRWTETYVKTNSDGSESHGYWHMDAYDPEFHMIDWNREVDFQVFNVSFKDDLVIMQPKNDKQMTFTYRRK